MGIAGEALKNLIRKPATRKYPKEKPKIPENFRGKLTFDKKRCIACGLCKAICPTHAIKLKEKIEEIKTEDIKPKKSSFICKYFIHSIDIGKCVSCGLCVNICPEDVISFTKEFEMAEKDKKKLIVK